jgi:hypothetical protein
VRLTTDRHWQPGPEGGLSRFLIPYLLMLLSLLLAVHLLQPQRDGPGSSSRSPAHQERQKAG